MKFMNMKRFGSIAMAGALSLSLAAPAFAATNNTTTIEGAYKEIPISVVVPTTGTAQINPYGLPITLTKSNESTVNLVDQQITTRPLSIKNTGDVALDVGVKSFVVVPKGDVEIDTSASTDKTIDVSLEMVGLDDSKYALSAENEGLEDLLIDAFADDATWAGANSVAAPSASKGDTAADITAANGNNLATLGAATVGDTITYGNDSIALFRLTGNVAQEPVDGSGNETPWAETDGFTATIVFKFTPAASSPSAGDATVTVGITGTTATATFNAGTSGLTATTYAWASDNTSVATVAGSSNTGTITQDGSATTGQTATITVTVTLDNGAQITGTATYTAT